MDESVYLQWDSAHIESNILKLEHFKDSTKTIRSKEYRKQVQSYFNPFFIHRTEVTNYQYRQFIYWVRDSLIMEEIFLHYPDFNKAKQILDIPKNIILKDTNDRLKIRDLYNLNFDCEYRKEKVFKQIKIVPIISVLYLSPSVRWYKRKEIDVRLLEL